MSRVVARSRTRAAFRTQTREARATEVLREIVACAEPDGLCDSMDIDYEDNRADWSTSPRLHRALERAQRIVN